MAQRDDDEYEPVFKKSAWGTNRYVYNSNNPVGIVLIVSSVVFALVMMFLMKEGKGPFEPRRRPPGLLRSMTAPHIRGTGSIARRLRGGTTPTPRPTT